MSERDIFMQLFNISVNTYYLWKKQERPIVKLLEKYFLKEELSEFIETGKIIKFENLNSYTVSSCISFLIKLEQLDIKEFYGFTYFSRYIIYYIKKGFEPDKDGNEYWIGENELKSFQNDFIKFLLELFDNSKNNDLLLDDLRYLTSFINDFTESDLIFLNMNVNDNFNLLLDFEKSNKEFYSKQKHTFVQFENSLINSLKEELSEDGDLKELMFLYKKSIINNS